MDLAKESSQINNENTEYDIYGSTSNDAQASILSMQIEFIKEKVVTNSSGDVSWTNEALNAIQTFLRDSSATVLYLWKSETNNKIDGSVEPLGSQFARELWYFVKNCDSAFVRPTSSQRSLENIRLGTIYSSASSSLWHKMCTIYRDPIIGSRWPQFLDTEFKWNFEEFFVGLNKICSTIDHSAMLWTLGALDWKDSLCRTNRDTFNDRMFSTVDRYLEILAIQWLQQCDELVNFDSNSISDCRGPLEELEVMHHHLRALTKLSEQLESPHVHRLRQRLTLSQSLLELEFDHLSPKVKDAIHMMNTKCSVLESIEGPCQKMLTSSIEEASLNLADVMNRITAFQADNAHTLSDLELNSLTQIICRAVVSCSIKNIKTSDICHGFMKTCLKKIHQSIELCLICKKLLNKFKEDELVNSYLLLDSFLQRCAELMQFCECVKVFGRWEDGQKKQQILLETHHNQKFVEILNDAETIFDQFLQNLSQNPDVILDLYSPHWREYRESYEHAVANIETLIQNVLDQTFSKITDINMGIEILNGLKHLTVREKIKKMHFKKAEFLYSLYCTDLAIAQREFVMLSKMEPQESCQQTERARVAHFLKYRIEEPLQLMKEVQWWPPCPTMEITRCKQQELSFAIDAFISKIFDAWSSFARQHRDSGKLLDVPLFCKNNQRQEFLDCNLKDNFLQLCKDAGIWLEIGKDIQSILGSLSDKCNYIVELRECVKLAVENYNRIVGSLSPHHKNLFKSKIAALDEKYSPGLYGFTWTSLNITSVFFKECKDATSEMQELITQFNILHESLKLKCQSLETLRVIILKCDYPIIDLAQYKFIQMTKLKEYARHVFNIHSNIQASLLKMESLLNMKEQRNTSWVDYVDSIDKEFEDSLKTTLKSSLLKTLEVMEHSDQPCLKLVLKEINETEIREMFSPIGNLVYQLLNLFKELPRFTTMLTSKEPPSKDIYLTLCQEESFKDIQGTIAIKIDQIWTQFLEITRDLKRYLDILKVNPRIFLDTYQKQQPTPETIAGDANCYSQITKTIQITNSNTKIEFLQIDFSELIEEMTKMATEWEHRFHKFLMNKLKRNDTSRESNHINRR